MSRFHDIVSAPSRLCRRFERWCDRPGSIEGLIHACDRVLPMIWVTVVSVLAGVCAAGLIAACLSALHLR